MPQRLFIIFVCLLPLSCIDYDLADDDAVEADDDVMVGDDDMEDDDVADDDDIDLPHDDDEDLDDDDDTAVGDDDDSVGDDDDVEPVLPNPCVGMPSALWVPLTYGSIQAAINAAAVGDLICVEPGTYFERIDFLGKDISVVGVGGPLVTIIDGMAGAPVVNFTNGESPAALLQGFTVRNGWSSYEGGGFMLNQSSPTLSQLIVEDNYADYEGGGFEMRESSPILDWVIVRDNTCAYQGGGMNLRYSSPRMSNVAFVNNTAGYEGGGLVVYYTSNPLLTNVVFAGNFTNYQGGAIDQYNSTLTLENVTLLANESTYSGGAIELWESHLMATNVSFVGNMTYYEGGAINLAASSILELINADLTGNIVTNGSSGGAIHVSTAGGGGCLASLLHCNAFGNTTPEFDGMGNPIGANGNVSFTPVHLDTSNPDPYLWDIHIGVTSTLIDSGDPALVDPDGSTSDIGAYGGTGAELWDLDWDAYPEWWLPGPFDPATSPNMDCDDRDESVYPGAGC